MRRDNFIYLLVALLIFLVLLPILDDLDMLPERLGRSLSVICLYGVGVWSLRHSLRVFRVGLALVTVGIVTHLLALNNDSTLLQSLSLTTLFLFLLLAAVVALSQVIFGTEMNLNRLFGAVCVYLLLGVLWSILYGALAEYDPNAFSGHSPAPLTSWDSQWIYYSFVTLTTLGYGDIMPVSESARILAYTEAVFGVFYMAVLVAALVGAYASERQK